MSKPLAYWDNKGVKEATSVRLSRATRKRLDRIKKGMKSRFTFAPSRSDVIRAAIAHGLDELERQYK